MVGIPAGMARTKEMRAGSKVRFRMWADCISFELCKPEKGFEKVGRRK